MEPGSAAACAGVQVGDEVVTADGHILRDIIDWRWYADEERTTLGVRRAGRDLEIRLEREPGAPWGIGFTSEVFDGIRTCDNACAFCFVSQLPRGLRPSLYVRDDDYRLSFLHGNFVTLTNLDDAEVARIAEQRLSPLYVSVHAVSRDVRDQLVRATDDRGLERLDELLARHIALHAQIVLVPGVNDREELDTTLAWLLSRDGVVSVGIVPVGFTAHQHGIAASYTDPGQAAAVISRVSPWQQRSRTERGSTSVYLADELYLNAGIELPAAREYDDFPQFENGIGMVRTFLDELNAESARLRAVAMRLESAGVGVRLLTGELFAPALREALTNAGVAQAGALAVDAVPNRFFGGNVSVAGLLTASDIEAALAGSEPSPHRHVLVPDVVLNDEGVTLDDVAWVELVARVGRDMSLVSSNARGLLEGLESLSVAPLES